MTGRVQFNHVTREQAQALKTRIEKELNEKPDCQVFQLWFDFEVEMEPKNDKTRI